MGRRMALWYAGTVATLLLLATAMLYLTVEASLDQEGDKYLEFYLDYLIGLESKPRVPSDEEIWPECDYRILDESGRAAKASPAAGNHMPSDLIPGAPGVNYLTPSGKWVRALARRSGSRTVEVCYDRSRELGMLRRYRYYMAIVMIPALISSTAASIVIVRRGLRPVGQIAATARRIGPERLNERIATEGLPSELSDLAGTFNLMLDRLQGAFDRLERFSGDIAHELRTPVHSIRNVAEVAIGTSRSRDEDREALAVCLDSAGHLSRLIDRLLFLARAGDPRTVLELETIDLAKELESIRDFYEPAAAEAGIDLAISVETRLCCRLDRTLLQRALGNLLTNAFAHTTMGGRVNVSASDGDGALTITVADTGTGIAAEHLPLLFDRFYRPDASRSAGGGVGLGLAIVKSIAELHGGTVSISSRPGEGTMVTVRLPMAEYDETVISP
ncbi:heavy metal sensor histidine kinase [Singulisphaera sp. PoT]|uniref:heavy metal sensor histidine kinase n=1 Tax=Singulisphaera sp. PoT TaxID=3411797 RepID=UPI003BF560F6